MRSLNRLVLVFILLFLQSFIYANCDEIDNLVDCHAYGCEWNDEEGRQT